jgi:Tol biopolymer transport system component
MKNRTLRYQSTPITIPAPIALAVFGVAAVMWAAEVCPASGQGHSLSLDNGCSFGPAQHLGPPVSSPLFEGGPTVSADQETLIFVSNRDAADFQDDLFTSTRRNRREPWGTLENLGPVVNDPVGDDASPRLSLDGKALYFSSNRAGGFGSMDLWVATRQSRHHPWESPQNLGPLINTSGFEGFPTPSADGNTLYFDRAAGGGPADIWVSTRSSEHDPWGSPEPLPPGINGPGPEFSPSISTDGRTLYFASGRGGNIGVIDVWVSTRLSLSDPWGPPQNLGPNVNSPSSLTLGPFITANGRFLYFMSTRAGGLGQPGCQFPNCFDLYVAERVCHDDGAH